MAKNTKKKKQKSSSVSGGLKYIIIIAVLAVVGYLAYVKRNDILLFLTGSNRTSNTSEVKIIIPDGLSTDSLAGFLVSKNILDDKKGFVRQMEKLQLSASDLDGGKYAVLSGTKVNDFIDGMRRMENGHGKNELKVKVVFNRCRFIEDIGKNISLCIEADSASIVDYIKSPKALRQYNFTQEQIPALFIPKEYEMYYDTDAEEFVSIMAEEFKKFWTEERKQKVRDIGLKFPSQAVTLASIVYSEQSRVKEEWPIIARLYLNRVNIGMKLQSDPTFKFCWGTKLDKEQRLTGIHRAIACKYNTYQIQGLPPGPICLVNEEVLDAVLNPDKNNYLFMCAQTNYTGKHDFTASDVQHMKNAAIYQKWLKEQIKK